MSSPHDLNSPRPSDPWSIPDRRSTEGRKRSKDVSSNEEWLTASPSPTRSIGERIAQRFRIIKQVGRGGMGTVYEAQDELRDERVALKFLNESLLQDPAAARRFLKEARISIRLQHPCIMRVYEVHEDRGQHFFSMELISAENLREAMNRWESTKSRPTVQEALQTIVPLLDALEYAHQHTVHRDIKPENIAMPQDSSPILMDFGIAEAQRSLRTTPNRETVSTMRAGTPYYMAPEQIKNPEHVDSRADQYSIAVVIYEILTGELPIGYARSMAELLPNGYEAFGMQVDRALAPDPNDRFRDISSFKAALLDHATPRFHWSQWKRKHPHLATFILITTVITVGCVLWSTAQGRAQDRAREDKRAYGQAQVVMEANYQREQILQASALEWRSNRDWLERQFKLEQRAWNSGLTNFQQWSQLANISNQLNKARFIWEELEPELNSNGLPRRLASLTSIPSQARANTSAHAALSQALARSNEIEKAQLELTKLTTDLNNRHQATRISNQISTLLATENLPQGWLPDLTNISEHDLAGAVERGVRAVRTKLDTWNSLFGYHQAPDLSFIASPSNHLRRATFLIEQQDYASAVDDLSSAYRILTDWTTEVQSLRARTEKVWREAAKKEQTDFGMRFIWTGDRYWSLCEVTVMDFARFMTESPHLNKEVGTFWKAPGYPQGPTHPVVGIDRDTAVRFTVWISTQFNKRFPLTSRLPTREDWEVLLRQQANPYRIGLFTNQDEWESNHFATHYLDPGVPPGATTRPVASGPASTFGLFDCLGNVWEWCEEDFPLPRSFQHFGRPSTWILMGGSPDVRVSYHDYSPPGDNFVWLVRKDRIGFRPTFVRR